MCPPGDRAIARPGFQPVRDGLRRDAGRLKQAGQRISGIDGLVPRRVPVQLQEDLPVREPVCQPVRGVHRKRRLPDPRHPVDRADVSDAARASARHGREDGLDFRLPSRERDDVARQRAGGSGDACRQRPVDHIPVRAEASARGSLKPGPVVPGQAESIRQQPGSVPARGPADPAFQVTDGPVTHPGGFRQLFLSQPGSRAQRAQQAAKRHRKQLGHLDPDHPRLDD